MEKNKNGLNHNPISVKLASKKSRKLMKAIKQSQSVFKFYSWELLQNYAYICYLSNFRAAFESKEERKRLRVFTHMSRLLKTRNSYQTKSHHQKMILKHKTVEDIINHFTNKITNQLSQNPHLISEIERINKDAEEFFRHELQKNTQEIVNTQSKQKTPKSIKTVKMTKKQREEIKLQEDLHSCILKQVKIAKNFVAAELVCLKEEQQSDMIFRVYP